jgi:signal transduction histidine kinase
LNSLVEGTLAQLEGRALSASVSVSAELSSEPVLIRADEVRLRQVLINLVGNALKFTEKGTVSVQVAVDQETGEAEAIHVRDTGRGIAPGRLSHIFRAFEQEDGTTSRRHGGSGLGLAISESLCQEMGLSLEVESVVGKGSTFSIILNQHRESASSSPAE